MVPPAVKKGFKNSKRYKKGTYLILSEPVSVPLGAKITISKIQRTIRTRKKISLPASFSPKIK